MNTRAKTLTGLTALTAAIMGCGLPEDPAASASRPADELDTETSELIAETSTSHMWDVVRPANVKPIVDIPYVFKPEISAKNRGIWLDAMDYWYKTTLGRFYFHEVSNPTGKYVSLGSDHARYGRCAAGAESPTNCTLRDMQIIGMDLRNDPSYPLVTLFADLAINEGTHDDLEAKGWDKYLTARMPINPDTGVRFSADDVDGIAFQDSGPVIITWFKNGTFRSKGRFPSSGDPNVVVLDDYSAVARVSHPRAWPPARGWWRSA
jgi:hypothetical protein